MKKEVVSAQEMLAFDRMAIEKLGIPSLVLMENAGRGLAEEVLRSLKKIKNPVVTIVCGTGNNGGDGLVAARHLVIAGIKAKIFLVGKVPGLKKDPAINFQILKNIGLKVSSISRVDKNFQNTISKSHVIVDALFGVGLDREIREPFKGVISFLNSSKKKIISADVPSGLDATSGKIHGVCVKASKTVAFCFPKKGFYKNSGPRYTGQIVIKDIGVPHGR